ncbi:MAG: hypothetical protein JF595_08595 [Sphingomonadales bacterium]|nr:hypothetical protein [Sphingomonadales bacterium]
MSDFMPIDRRSMLERALLLLGASAAASVSPAALARAVAAPKPYLAQARSSMPCWPTGLLRNTAPRLPAR